MIRLLTGAAALALAASAVHADPGGGKGGGKDKGDHAGHAMQGPGGDHAKGQGGGKPDRVVAGGQGQGQGNRGQDRAAQARVDRPEKSKGNGGGQRASRDERGRDVVEVRDRREVVIRDRRDGDRDGRDRFDWDEVKGRGLVDGCPPGLAKKNNGCMPPGLARDRNRFASFYDRPDWWGLSGLNDGRYAYYNGNLVRLGDNNRVLGYLPLLGGALAPGNVWPSYYEPVALPGYYQDYYGLGPMSGYRYYDDAIYQVDPQTSAITSIAALLTGDNFAVGQPLPPGYGVYNVPYSYRDRYVDGPDAYYRYSDGYVYQVDPATQLISSVIELLT